MRASPRVALLAAAIAAAVALPAQGQEGGARVILRWQAIQGAVAYDLQLARDPAFAQRELEVRVELAGYRLARAPDGRRYWRVRSVDADGRPGPWSAAKTVDPPAAREPLAPPAPPPEPEPEREPSLLNVPPLDPAALPEAGAVEREPAAAEAAPQVALLDPPPASSLVVEEEPEGISVRAVLAAGRPGVALGWRANLRGVDAPTVAVEGDWPLPWLGAAWRASLRAGWWRERAATPVAFEATADVVPITALLLGSRALPWGRAYGGAGVGADLVLVRLATQGALEASAAGVAVVGAGRRLGPGEGFAELAGSVGGVDGPLGRLRTGGISLSVGYRLIR